MNSLFCFGFGYTAAAYISAHGAEFTRISGSVRTPEKAARLEDIGGRAVSALLFDDRAGISEALKDTTLLLVSIPPLAHGDPSLMLYGDALRQTRSLRSIVYLSTIGVYGDQAGGWIDETTPARPKSPRSRERLQAELQWQEFGREAGIPVAIFRLPGIYGPGRNALANLVNGDAKRINKPGQIFNRIHVGDIAQAIEAAHAKRASGIFNICDDEPAPAPDLVTFAAGLLSVTPPPEIDFDTIKDTMSPMALSFYSESKRARNSKMKEDLGVTLAYPSYREGLQALFQAGEGSHRK